MSGTTSIKELKENGFKNFTWGWILEHYEFGPYNIVKYESKTSTEYEISYHGWVDGKSTSQSWPTLDRAILGVVSRKAEGLNSRADRYMADMIKLPEEDPEQTIKRAHS